jgi:hypothetical protein
MLKGIPSKPNSIIIPKDTKVVRAIHVDIKEGKTIEGYMTYKALVIMDYMGYLPKGYLTRVKNGHIKLSTAIKKIQSVKSKNHFPYNMTAKHLGNNRYIVVLVKSVTTKSA